MYGINCIFSFLSIIIIIKMKNKVNKKRGVKFLRGRAREGWGKSPHLFNATARPRSGQKRAGKKEGGLSVISTRNFCPPAGFWWRVGVRPPSADAPVRSRCRDFVQSRFEFYPKDTAILQFRGFA